MKRLDRIIMVVFLVGVWGLLGTIWLNPSNVDAHADGHTHDSYDVYGVAEEGHSHDYADSYHTHRHSHTCDVSGSYAECY